VKFRSEDTTSERQLVMALARTGRNVPLSRLTAWRKDGLLPPLSSTGLGAGAGRAYYWLEPDIVAHAAMAHDGMARHGRADMVALALWLRGFTVPLPKLRRAWQSRLKARKTRTIHKAPWGSSAAVPADLSQVLLQAMLGAAGAVRPDDADRPMLLMLAGAARRLDIPAGDSTQRVRQFWQMAQLLTCGLAATDLLAQASDEEMLQAQEYLRRTLRFIADSVDDEIEVVVRLLGETVFLYVLALLRSGQNAVLEAVAARMADTRRQPAQQSEPLHARA
jgi:hypothetical protein